MAAPADLLELDVLELETVLFELAADEPEGELGAQHRHPTVERLEQIGKGTGVVFVAVGDDDGAQLLLALHDVGEVGKDQVDPGVVIVREHDAGVDDHHVVPVFEDGHVLAYAVKPAEGDDAEASLILCHAVCSSPFDQNYRSLAGQGPGQRRESVW